jgi:TonB family protein
MTAPQRFAREIEFGRYSSDRVLPAHGRVTAGVYVIALLLHVALFVALFLATRERPVRMAPGQSATIGIAAYIPGPTGTAGSSTSSAAQIARPKKPAPARAAKAMPAAAEPDDADGGSGQQAATAGQGGAGSGPVRLGSGGNLTLLTKVTPVYPRMFEQARMPGTVVLDAVIHRDGTIGDVRVLQSTNDAFAQAAIAAVKQWRYTPIPYEGIVTVTVNFTIPR